MKRKKGLLAKIFSLTAVLAAFGSCELFENDVEDFMEKYTETAAIEAHEIHANTYEDGYEQLCIASEEDADITFYMRNPKQFQLIPSVSFFELDSKISRSAVDITQSTNAVTRNSAMRWPWA